MMDRDTTDINKLSGIRAGYVALLTAIHLLEAEAEINIAIRDEVFAKRGDESEGDSGS